MHFPKVGSFRIPDKDIAWFTPEVVFNHGVLIVAHSSKILSKGTI